MQAFVLELPFLKFCIPLLMRVIDGLDILNPTLADCSTGLHSFK
jgi:hypothetical protein